MEDNEKINFPETVERMPDEKITQLAMDIVEGRVFTDRQIKNQRMLGAVFMPVALGVFAEAPASYVKSIGMIYEYLDKAGPMAINGMPTFFSIRIIAKEDLPLLQERVDNYLKAKEQFTESQK